MPPSGPPVCVYAAAKAGPPSYQTTTDGNGNYVFTDIAVGQYDVFFDPTCHGTQPSTYAAQYYNDVPRHHLGDLGDRGDWGERGRHRRRPATRRTVSGVVSGQGGPLQGVCVIAYDSVNGDEVVATTTAADGSYSVAVAPGRVLVAVPPDVPGHQHLRVAILQRRPRRLCRVRRPANVIGVSRRGHPHCKRDFQEASEHIEGRWSPRGDHQRGYMRVRLRRRGGDQIGGVLTDLNGTYQLTDLPAQTYRVVFDPTCNEASRAISSPRPSAADPSPARPSTGISGTWPLTACVVAPRSPPRRSRRARYRRPTRPPCRLPAAPAPTRGPRSGCPPRAHARASTGSSGGSLRPPSFDGERHGH